MQKKSSEKDGSKELTQTIARDILPPPEESAEDFEEVRVKDRSRNHKKILLTVLIFGIIGILAVFFYRDHERDKDKKELESQLKTFEESLITLEAKLREFETVKEIEEPPQDEDGETTPKETVPQGEEEVVILETPTGWLNLRDGPGTSYAKVDLVYPGESYPLLEEREGWYKIKLDIDKEGWIAAEYAGKE